MHVSDCSMHIKLPHVLDRLCALLALLALVWIRLTATLWPVGGDSCAKASLTVSLPTSVFVWRHTKTTAWGPPPLASLPTQNSKV